MTLAVTMGILAYGHMGIVPLSPAIVPDALSASFPIPPISIYFYADEPMAGQDGGRA